MPGKTIGFLNCGRCIKQKQTESNRKLLHIVKRTWSENNCLIPRKFQSNPKLWKSCLVTPTNFLPLNPAYDKLWAPSYQALLKDSDLQKGPPVQQGQPGTCMLSCLTCSGSYWAVRLGLSSAGLHNRAWMIFFCHTYVLLGL